MEQRLSWLDIYRAPIQFTYQMAREQIEMAVMRVLMGRGCDTSRIDNLKQDPICASGPYTDPTLTAKQRQAMDSSQRLPFFGV
jgi:hypothetical protein